VSADAFVGACTNYENASGLPTFKMAFCGSGENHQVGTDFTLPFQPVQDSRCGVIAARAV
jgi:hypothetical protein